jgi:hypothetical protein
LKSDETKCDFATKNTKQYVKKSEPKVEQKVETKLPSTNPPINAPTFVPAEVKPAIASKTQPANPVAKEQAKSDASKQEESPEAFVTYTFLKKAFPKKTSFKDWLTANKFDSSDYQTVEKIAGREDYAKITMKRKVFLALNGATYNGEKIEFVPE